MGIVAGSTWLLDAAAREAMLFAAMGFLVGGLDDLLVDLIFLVRSGWRGLTVRRRYPVATLADFDGPVRGRMVVFVAAWDEAAVIGAMLSAALARFDHPDYRIYVGAYPNDRATVDAIAAVTERDRRVRLVINARNGPTTKADCLNHLWHALLRDEAAGAARAKAIVLHDAEDVVHPGELRIFDRLTERHWVVQLPVLPLPHRGSRLISGHYLDEFAEAHSKQLVVREALGAGLPLAGVGCAIARPALEAVAHSRRGAPFDATSLTEDYELGLAIADLGGSGILARVPERPGGPVVAVRAYFPDRLTPAVRQKARWMVGIALAGWDRIGWSRWSRIGDHWMRMRDRRAPIAVLVLFAAYCAFAAWTIATAAHWLTASAPPPIDPALEALLSINAVLLVWRLAMRATFTGRAYGRAEAAWSVPRAIVGNLVAMMAAQRALMLYLRMLLGEAPRWDKTAHVFPDADIIEAGDA